VDNAGADYCLKMGSVIVIPTYNEKNNIRPLVEEVFRIAPAAKILIVDDNSPDGTGKVADELANKYTQIAVLHRKRKEGLGKAYIAGFEEALKINPDYIIQMDADFSHNPKYIPQFLREIKNYDLVLGSRFINGEKRPAHVSIMSVWANRYARWILGLKISDCLGGFKCCRKEMLKSIELDKFTAAGFVFQAEFIYRAYKKGFTIKEIPINFYERKSGRTKKSIKIILEAFLKIPLLRLHAFRLNHLP